MFKLKTLKFEYYGKICKTLQNIKTLFFGFLSVPVATSAGGVVEVQKLPGWSPWSGWTSCSVTCGYGDSFRQAHWLDKDGQRLNETTREHMGCYIPKSCPGMYKLGLFHF